MMETGKLDQRVIETIMDNFDFEKVQKYMQATDWKWGMYDGKGEDERVPNVEELKKTARYILQSDEVIGTGGFTVIKYSNKSAELIFKVTSRSAEIYDDEVISYL